MGGMPAKKADLAPWIWGIGITALLLLPLPTDAAARRWPALVRDLTDFSHPLAFAWLAHVSYRSLRARMPRPSLAPYVWVIAGAGVYGAATELVQSLVDRQPSLTDFRNDMLGTAFTLLIHVRGEPWAKAARPGFLVLAAVAGLVAVLPLATTLAAYGHRFARVPVLWEPESRWFAHFSRWEAGSSPVLRLNEPAADWTGYGYLEIDIGNPLAQSHLVTVRVHDLWHDQRHVDRFNRRFGLEPQSRQVLRIPLDDIRRAPQGRDMDMEMIRGVVVFSVAQSPGEFRVYGIRLAR
jgi:hypothetical protein